MWTHVQVGRYMKDCKGWVIVLKTYHHDYVRRGVLFYHNEEHNSIKYYDAITNEVVTVSNWDQTKNTGLPSEHHYKALVMDLENWQLSDIVRSSSR